MGACTHSAVVISHRGRDERPESIYRLRRMNVVLISLIQNLCMIEYIPELVKAGIDSLKIEGRMKTALYVATVARNLS